MRSAIPKYSANAITEPQAERVNGRLATWLGRQVQRRRSGAADPDPAATARAMAHAPQASTSLQWRRAPDHQGAA